MKVCFITASLSAGGAERVCSILANGLSRRGISVSVLSFDKYDEEYAVDSKIDITYVGRKKSKMASIVFRIKSMKAFLKKKEPDFVICLQLLRYLFWSRMVSKYQFILSERNDPHQYSKVEKYIRCFLFHRANHVVFQTKDALEYYSSLVNCNSVVIPNPIRNDLPTPYCGIRKKQFVAFNRLSPQKNIPMMLEAFARFHSIYSDYRLDIYGNGELKSYLLKYAHTLSIDEFVSFHEFSTNIHSLIIQSFAFLSSSDYEGLSNSMLEAMAIGLPVICTDCPIGGAKQAISNYNNGLLVTVGDSNSMCDAMIWLVEHPNEANTISCNASKIRDEWSQDSIVNAWMSLLS